MTDASQALSPKQQQRDNWARVVVGWRKHDAGLVKAAAPASEKLLDLAGVAPGSRVLDVASGTGEPAIPAAKRVGPSGSVLGTDFVESMLSFAREKAAAAGLTNIEFREVDGEALDVPAGTFDAATIRWGLMFMPDPVGCLRGVHTALKPGGRLAVACWAGPERNPWAAIPMSILMKHAGVPRPPAGAPGPFAFADAERLKGALAEAGFKDVVVDALEMQMIDLDSIEAYWTQTRELGGPVAALIEKLTQEQKAAVAAEMVLEVSRASPGDRVRLKGTTWLAAGRK